MADETYTGVMVALIPAESDPIVAASSEPAHLTVLFLGDSGDLDPNDVRAAVLEVEAYATELDGPLIMPVLGTGKLGDEGATVANLKKTDAATYLRQGLLESASTVSALATENDQFLNSWSPHVTLSYPDRPANAEYAGEAVTFDRIAVWVGDEHHDFDMGGTVADEDEASQPDQGSMLAAARAKIANFDMAGIIADVDDDELDEMPPDELEEGEELITEVPVHGVAAIEGRATGDGRGFRPGALSFGTLPQPLGYEFEHGHGSANSRVAIVGRIDEYWTVETDEEGVFEARWRGVIFPHKEWGARAIESIIDGSYTGVSIVPDSVTVDVSEQREKLRKQILAERAGKSEVLPDTEIPAAVDDEEFDVEALLDAFVGDGTMDVTWYSEARVRRFDMVPTGAFIEAYTALGAEFADEMTPEEIEASAAALADCGCAESKEEAEALVADVVAAGFAPGAKDGGVGTLAEWSNLTSGPLPSSTTEPTTTSAGTGLATSTAKGMDEWPWTGTVESARLIESSTSDGSAPSLTDSFSIISAGTGDASIHDTSNLSPTERTLIAETRTTAALVASAGMASTTSPIQMRGTSGLSMEFSDGRVVPVTSMDVANGIVRLSDATVLAAREPLGNFAPGTRDGPGWITHPTATARIRRYWVHGKGAAKIRWGVPGDFNRCRTQLAKYVQNPDWLAGLCANLHKEAIGVWPGQEGGGSRRHSLLSYASAHVGSRHEGDRVSVLVAGGADGRLLAVARHADNPEARESLRGLLGEVARAGEGAPALLAAAGGLDPAWHDAGPYLRAHGMRESGAPASGNAGEKLSTSVVAAASGHGGVHERARLDGGESDAAEVRVDALPGVSSLAVAGELARALRSEEGGLISLAASATPAPLLSLVAAAAPVDAALFANPNLEGDVGVVIEGEHVYGYIALWNVCHIGQPDGPSSCTLAPRSATNYSHFRTGTVMTTEGPVAVGSITMNTGHAGGRLSAVAAAAHYDNTGTVIADVACGEDRYGIWYSGRKRPGVSDDDVYAAMASGRVSGDWRKIGGNYELVGALIVNVAGFPIPNASLVASADTGAVTAIIGEGIVPLEQEAIVASAQAAEALTPMSAEDIAGVALAAVESFVALQQRQEIVSAAAPARAAVMSYALADARRRVASITSQE